MHDLTQSMCPVWNACLLQGHSKCNVWLQMVGLGVAMGNASQACLEAADVQLSQTNNEDGVAEALERYILEPAGIRLTAPRSEAAKQALPKP